MRLKGIVCFCHLSSKRLDIFTRSGKTNSENKFFNWKNYQFLHA